MTNIHLSFITEQLINKPDYSGILDILDLVYCTEFVLYTKTLGTHWNIRGPQFTELHTLLGEHYLQLLNIIDRVVEQMMMLDPLIRTRADLKHISDRSIIVNNIMSCQRTEEFLSVLEQDHTSMIDLLTQASKCAESMNLYGVVELLGGIITEHDKMRWFLRSHLS